MKLTGISLFTGAGGMDVGFKDAGFEILWANDIMPDACETYRANHGNIIEYGDLNLFIPYLTRFKGADIVFGGPPCQGFSVAGKMDPGDIRSQMVFRFMDVVEHVQPRAFVLENVKALATLTKWGSVRDALLERAQKLGYIFREIIVLTATDFGVPQKRQRMFFVGMRDVPSNVRGSGIMPLLEKYKSQARPVGEIIKKLGPAGSSTNPKVCRAKITLAKGPILRRSPYAGMLFNGMGRPIDPNGFANTLPASMGGNKTPIVDENQIFRNKLSWIEDYHKKIWNKKIRPCFCDAPGHLRRLTVDEAALIQTFPLDYKFIGKQNSVYTQIGNAVPCKLAYAVGRAVHDALIKTRNNHLETRVVKRVVRAKA